MIKIKEGFYKLKFEYYFYRLFIKKYGLKVLVLMNLMVNY